MKADPDTRMELRILIWVCLLVAVAFVLLRASPTLRWLFHLVSFG